MSTKQTISMTPKEAKEAVKLSPAQADVVRKMREGEDLEQNFSTREFWIGQHRMYCEDLYAIRDAGLVVEYRQDKYELTPLGRTVDLG